MRLPVYPYAPARQAPRDHDQRRAVVPQWRCDAPDRLLRVSAQAVLTWIRDVVTDYYAKPEPTGRTIVLQRDAMGYYLKHKRHTLWIWKALDRDTGQLLDWECGRRDKKTLQKMVDRLAQWDVTMYCTDKWASMRRSSHRTSWCKAQPRRMRSNGIPVGNGIGLAASYASRSLSPSRKRWWISPWPCLRSFGSMETRMNSYHYLIETLRA
jgi:IS1 family transposase